MLEISAIFSAVADLARPLAAAAELGLGAWWLGSKARRALRIETPGEEPVGRAGVDVALGLALLAALGFWLGIAGWLTLWGVLGGAGVLAGALWAIGAGGARSAPPSCPPPARGGGTFRREDGEDPGVVRPEGAAAVRNDGYGKETLRRNDGPGEGSLRRNESEESETLRRSEGGGVLPPCGGGSRRGVLTVAALIFLPLVALALYPPIGFDALMYHLPFAKAFVLTGHLPFLPDLRFPVFPQASEVLFAEAMLLGGDRAAQLVSLLGTAATAAILFGWARRVAREGETSGAGELSAAFFLGGPVVAYLSGTGFCEPLLVMFCAAAFDRIDRFGIGLTAERRRWPLAGAFAGSAAAVKYFGLFAVGAVVATALFARAESRTARARRLAGAVASVLLFAGPWYVRNAFYTGNPVFPLFPRLFGASVWTGPSELAPWSEGHGLSQLFQMLRLPWTLTFGRPEFGRVPPWSPVLIVALAAALIASAKDRRVRWLLGASLVYLSAFFFLPLDSRYLMPVLPLLCVAAAASVRPLLGRHRLLVPAALLLAIAPTALWNVYQLHRLGPLPASSATRLQFLDLRLPAYPALRYLARTRGASASVYAFYAENHVYYAPGRFQGDWGGRTPFAEMAKLARSGDRLADELRARGVTHLLTVVASEPPLPRDASFARRFRPVYDDGKARVWEIR